MNDGRYVEKLQGEYAVRHKITRCEEKRLPHIHAEFELCLIHSPGMTAMINENAYALAPGTLLLLGDMDLHHLRMDTPGGVNDRHVLYFKPECVQAFSTLRTNLLECFLYRPFEDAQLLRLSERDAQKLSERMDELAAFANAEHREYGDDLQAKMMLSGLLLSVNRLYRDAHGLGSGAHAERYAQVYPIIAYLHAHYQDELSLDDLAQRFYMNKTSLCALFREATGVTPNQYLIRCRLLKAKELLLAGHPVEQVCTLSGYNNLSHFSRTFKRHVGVSPKQFQQAGERG